MFSFLTLAIALALACVGSSSDKDSAVDSDSAGATACADLSPETCASDPSCSTLYGIALSTDAQGQCIDYEGERVPLGCLDGELGCGAAITIAQPADGSGECTAFTSTCIPIGWEVCDDNPPECAR